MDNELDERKLQGIQFHGYVLYDSKYVRHQNQICLLMITIRCFRQQIETLKKIHRH